MTYARLNQRAPFFSWHVSAKACWRQIRAVDTFCRLFRANAIVPGQPTDSALALVMRQTNGCLCATNELCEKCEKAANDLPRIRGALRKPERVAGLGSHPSRCEALPGDRTKKLTNYPPARLRSNHPGTDRYDRRRDVAL